MAISPGEILRKKREEKNLTLEQVAAGTSIRIHFLQAIEEDRVGAIASQTQYRGFTRLYASFLGLDSSTLFEDSSSHAEPAVTQGIEGIHNQQKTAKKEKPNLSINGLPQQTQKLQSEKKPEISSLSHTLFIEIGAALQQQREMLGLSLSDVERQTKIKELYLYALEAGQIDDLPSTVQGRGMLNNYASFMSMNSEVLQLRFAEGLQQKRIEAVAAEQSQKSSNQIKKYGSPITSWRRYLTPDLIIGSSVFGVLFVLIVWGAWQVIGSSDRANIPTVNSISSILVSSNTPTPPLINTTELPSLGDMTSTISVDLLATITSVSSGPIQIVVVAYQRAYLRVVSDGKEVFVGRVVPGSVNTFTGSVKVSLSTGNAAAIQVYYNQEDLGILGVNGQVVNLEFTSQEVVTPTPQFTATSTSTVIPTLTQQPTSTPRPTLILPTGTPTLLIPKK
ncbi:MAG: DUF4115 domain-containing protein [Chloroflexi bacterium]|nr:DUF4115 domain-containing protein [Chloroflexota bacterium]